MLYLKPSKSSWELVVAKADFTIIFKKKYLKKAV